MLKVRPASRKSCIDKMCKDSFGFDLKKERETYKFLSGENMFRREWDRNYTYCPYKTISEWKKSIGEKYKNAERDDLKEFKNLLNHRLRMFSTSKDLYDIFFTAIITMLITKLVEIFVQLKFPEANLWIKFLVLIMVIFVAFIPSYYLVNNIVSHLWDTKLDSIVIKQYKKEINKILKKKRKK